jgi:L-2-amino-thiazoline-4-carboxylic acid hydrolase
MDIEINPNVSCLDENKFQAEVLIPVLKALRAELGEERANRLVLGALREWSRERWHRLGERFPGSPKEKMDALSASVWPRFGNDVDIEWLRNDSEAMECDITGCRYADFFRQIGEPELGVVLCCEDDFHITEVGSPEVELTRTQTIMEGATYCDFRWRIKSGQVPK